MFDRYVMHEADFVVTDRLDWTLLCRDTAEKLDLLSIGLSDVNSVVGEQTERH